MRRAVAQIVVATGLLGLITWQGRVWELPGTVRGLNWWVARSRWVLVRLGYRLPGLSLLAVTTLGNVAGSLTPGGAGDLLRWGALRDRLELPGQAAASAVLYERLYIPLLLAISLLMAVAFSSMGASLLVVLLIVASTVTVVASSRLYPLAGAVIVRVAQARARRVRPSGGGWLAALAQVSRSLSSLFDDLGLAVRFVAATLAVYGLTAMQAWVILNALGGGDVGLAGAWLAYATASLTGMLSTLPGGLGLWDAAMAFSLAAGGVEMDTAVATAMLLRALSTLPLGVGAIASYGYLARGSPGGGRAAPRPADAPQAVS